MTMLKKTNCYQCINLDFDLTILVWISYYQLFITYTKALMLNPTPETHGVILDMSKAFDNVWHQGLIFKLKSVGVSDSLLNLIESFLSKRFQRVL